MNKIHERFLQSSVVDYACLVVVHLVDSGVLLSFGDRDTLVAAAQESALFLLLFLFYKVPLVRNQKFNSIRRTIFCHLLHPLIQILKGVFTGRIVCYQDTVRIPEVLLCKTAVLVKASRVPYLQAHSLAVYVHYPILVVEPYYGQNRCGQDSSLNKFNKRKRSF